VLGIFEIASYLFYLPKLASTHDPPDFCFPSAQDYKCEPPAPDKAPIFLVVVVVMGF
jgi:hypothetical protein